MICWTLGITEHHVARRQRALADQPRAALRPRRALRLGAATRCAARTTCRAAATWARSRTSCPASRTSSATTTRARASRRPGDAPIVPALRLAPDPDVPRHGARRAAHALRDRREPGAVRGRHQARPASCSSELDFLVVQDILLTSDRRARRRRPALGRLVVRVRGHRHELASGACSACARRSIRPARRATTCGSSAQIARAHGLRLGRADAPRRSGTSCARSRPMHARHELRAARGARAASSGPAPTRSHPGSPFLHARLWAEPLEGPPAPFSVVEHAAALRGARRRVPDPAHDGPPARVVQHRRADESLPLAAAPRRVARPLARGRRAPASSTRARSCACRRGAARSRRRCTIDPSLRPGPRVHDVPLPRPGRHEPAHDRRHRPEVRHRGVQGRRDPGREARAPPSARSRPASPSPPAIARRLMDIHLVSTPRRPPPSARRSTTCSGRRRRLGRR